MMNSFVSRRRIQSCIISPPLPRRRGDNVNISYYNTSSCSSSSSRGSSGQCGTGSGGGSSIVITTKSANNCSRRGETRRLLSQSPMSTTKTLTTTTTTTKIKAMITRCCSCSCSITSQTTMMTGIMGTNTNINTCTDADADADTDTDRDMFTTTATAMIRRRRSNYDDSPSFRTRTRSRSRQIVAATTTTSRRFFHHKSTFNYSCLPDYYYYYYSSSSSLTGADQNDTTSLGNLLQLSTTVGSDMKKRRGQRRFFMDNKLPTISTTTPATRRWLSSSSVACTPFTRDSDDLTENYNEEVVVEEENNNDVDVTIQTSMELPANIISEDVYQYRNYLIGWYRRNYPDNIAASHSELKKAFNTVVISNPVIVDDDEEAGGGGGNDVLQSDDASTNDDGNQNNTQEKKRVTQVYTSTFVCPISGRNFYSGKLPGAVPGAVRVHVDEECRSQQQQQQKQQSGDCDYSSKTDLSVNRWYYQKKKMAEQAAAMVALEDLSANDEGRTVTNDNVKASRTVPKRQLQDFYKTAFQVELIYDRDFEFSDFVVHGTRLQTGWNVKFICPVTGRTFRSSVENNGGHLVNGVGWHNSKSDALNSVAECVLKTITEEGIEVNRNGEVGGSPASSQEKIDSRVEPLASWYKKHYPKPESTHSDIDAVDQNNWIAASTISVDDHFAVTASESLDRNAGMWWTATFICPITGERFDSGSLPRRGRYEDSHGVSWYPEEDTAILAAACRAYDMMNYRLTRHSDPRFCKEDPSLSMLQTGEDVSDHDSTCLDETIRMGKVEIDNGENEISGYDDWSDSDDYDDEEYDLEDDSDEYVLELLPQRWASKPIPSSLSDTLSHNSSNTLDVIAQTWLDSMEPPKKVLGAATDASLIYDSCADPYSERENAIARAWEWSEKYQRKVDEVKDPDRSLFDINSQAGSLRIANLLLSSLAAAHQRIPFDSRKCGVEDAAQSILSTMRFSQNAMIPDGDSYAYFLKCLEGDSPKMVAHRGLKLVEDMKKGKDLDGVALPDPNISTYESVAALFIQAGLDIPEDVEFDFNEGSRSSRMAFLTELSAMAHDPPSFDSIRALKLVDEMKTAGLDVDEEVLNAPLRWAGGAQLPSKTFSRAVSFDSYDKIYQNDLRFTDNNTQEANVAHDQAEAMESWVEAMSSYGVQPNLQTYESLIQAWVRCGTIDGIKKAEVYGRKLLDGTLDRGELLRLETFYPIISALVYNGLSEGPVECEKWIKDIDDSYPELRARTNFHLASFLAQVCYQKSHPESFVEDTVDDLKILNSIDEKLRNLVEEFKSSGEVPSHDAFVLSIQASIEAFSALSRLPQSTSNKFDLSKECMNHLQQIVYRYDDLLERVFNSSSDNAGTECDVMDRVISLVKHTPCVYGAQWLALREMEKMNSVSSGTFLGLSQIESGIRRLGELFIFLDDRTKNNESSTYAKGSHQKYPKNWKYPFPYEKGLLSFSPPQTYEDVLGLALILMESMTDAAHPHNDADFIRLCMLICNIIQHPSFVRSEETASFQDKLKRVLTNCRVNEEDSLTAALISLIGHNSSFPNVNIKAELSHTDHSRARHGMDERKFNKRRKRVRGGSSRSTLNAQKSRGKRPRRR